MMRTDSSRAPGPLGIPPTETMRRSSLRLVWGSYRGTLAERLSSASMALMSLGQYSAGVGTRVGYSHCRNSRKATGHGDWLAPFPFVHGHAEYGLYEHAQRQRGGLAAADGGTGSQVVQRQRQRGRGRVGIGEAGEDELGAVRAVLRASGWAEQQPGVVGRVGHCEASRDDAVRCATIGFHGTGTLLPGIDQRSQGPAYVPTGVDRVTVLIPEVADGDRHVLGRYHAVVRLEWWACVTGEQDR